jgi:hypothetical protein
VVHNAMQVVGGIGYTNVLPLERIYRDIRLASIWTGTNEVMAMIVAHEWYREHGKHKAAKLARDYARDAAEADAADERHSLNLSANILVAGPLCLSTMKTVGFQIACRNIGSWNQLIMPFLNYLYIAVLYR